MEFVPGRYPTIELGVGRIARVEDLVSELEILPFIIPPAKPELLPFLNDRLIRFVSEQIALRPAR